MKNVLRLVVVCCALCITSVVSAELLPYPIDTVNGQAVYKYRVPRSIGIYRISVNFGVTQADIINWNPQLKERGLHYDEVILIPVAQEANPDNVSPAVLEPQQAVEPEIRPTIPPAIDDSVVYPAVDTVAVPDSVPEVATDTIHRTKIALLLPLQAESVHRDKNMDRFMDFYEGCLIALYDLQYADHFELYVYDTGKTDIEVKRLIADSVLHTVDAILGPAYPTQVEPIARLAQEDSIMTLIPFTDRVPDLGTNPFLMQFNPSAQVEAKAIVDYLEAQKEHINCVFVESKEMDIPADVEAIRQEVKKRGLPHTMVTMTQVFADSLFMSLKDSTENILFFNTDKFNSLQILLPHILNGKGGQSITLYSQYSWQKEKILLPQLYCTAFTTEGETDLIHYEAIYRQYFKHEHNTSMPRFDLLGYDLMRQLVATLQGKEYYGLQSDSRFERVAENGGWINTYVRVIHK